MTERSRQAADRVLGLLFDYLGGAPVVIDGEVRRLRMPQLSDGGRIREFRRRRPYAAAGDSPDGTSDRIMEIEPVVVGYSDTEL